jgi:hypothetical protein
MVNLQRNNPQRLASDIRAERPFVGYHALVALHQAIRNPDAKEHREEIENAVEILEGDRSVVRKDPDRANLLEQIINDAKNLPP